MSRETDWNQYRGCVECGSRMGKPCVSKLDSLTELKHPHESRMFNGFFSDIEPEQLDWEG